jgi:uncharacterized DUF497 family protein
MELIFEWDPRKAKSNLAKHRVSFEEATKVFFDPLAKIFADPYHSAVEPRELIIGHSGPSRLLMVCFVERESVVRLLSARQATTRERHDYQENS